MHDDDPKSLSPADTAALDEYMRRSHEALAARINDALKAVVKEMTDHHVELEKKMGKRVDELTAAITGGVGIDELGIKGMLLDHSQRLETLEKTVEQNDQRRWQLIVGLIITSVGALIASVLALIRSFMVKGG